MSLPTTKYARLAGLTLALGVPTVCQSQLACRTVSPLEISGEMIAPMRFEDAFQRLALAYETADRVPFLGIIVLARIMSALDRTLTQHDLALRKNQIEWAS